MKRLKDHLADYLALREALGFKIRTHGSLLRGLVAFLAARHADSIATSLVLAWATAPAEADPKWWAYRLRVAHHFARYVRGQDPRTEIPPLDLLPYSHRRPQPYIYSDEELRRLVGAARQLPSHNGLRAWTYPTLFGLLPVSGLRISEALGLDVGDVDLAGGLLVVRNAKYGKSRLVPMHPTTAAALREYAGHRDAVFPAARSPAFFVTVFGRRPTTAVVSLTLRQLCCRIGIRDPGARKGPRVHDFRHTFAVRALVELYRRGTELERGVHALSVLMGHAGPASTY